MLLGVWLKLGKNPSVSIKILSTVFFSLKENTCSSYILMVCSVAWIMTHLILWLLLKSSCGESIMLCFNRRRCCGTKSQGKNGWGVGTVIQNFSTLWHLPAGNNIVFMVCYCLLGSFARMMLFYKRKLSATSNPTFTLLKLRNLRTRGYIICLLCQMRALIVRIKPM